MTESRKIQNKLYTETYTGELWWLEKHFDIYNIEITSDNKEFVKYVSVAVNMAMKEFKKMEDERLLSKEASKNRFLTERLDMTESRKIQNKLYTETYTGELWWLEKHFDIYNIEITSDNKEFVKYVSVAVNMAMKEFKKMEDERLLSKEASKNRFLKRLGL